MADLSRDTLDRLQQRLDDTTEARPMDTDGKEDADTCPHIMLMPRWDAIDDMGKMDWVVGYRCDSCGRTLSTEEGRGAINAGAMVDGRIVVKPAIVQAKGVPTGAPWFFFSGFHRGRWIRLSSW